MEECGISSYMKDLTQYANARRPIDPKLLQNIPHFSDIFHNDNLWPILTRLSGDDGIAFIEHKQFQPGKRLIAKGQFDQMIYWVLAGRAHILGIINDQTKIVHKSRVGECIGALAVLRGTKRSADVVAGEEGVTVLELDWAMAEKNPQLGQELYHLIALNLADTLDNAYDTHLRIIANSLNFLREKTIQLIERNKKLERLLTANNIDIGSELQADHDQALTHAIANIKESLALLEHQEDKYNLDRFGIV